MRVDGREIAVTGSLLQPLIRRTNDILRLPTWPAKIVLLISFAAFFVVAIWRELHTFSAERAAQTGGPR